MKVFVPIKRVIDYHVKVRVKADHSGVETTNVKMSMNPFDEIALEEAVRLKEAESCDEVIAISCGTIASKDILISALAIAADRAILVESDEILQPLAVAKCLQQLVHQEQPSLVIMGKQAIDDDANQVGQMLAGLLGWPQATFASKIVLGEQSAEVTREVDQGLQTIKVTLPCVMTADLRLNEPRYPSMPNIMKAKQKPLDVIKVASLDCDVKARLVTQEVSLPETRKPGVICSSISDLLDKVQSVSDAI